MNRRALFLIVPLLGLLAGSTACNTDGFTSRKAASAADSAKHAQGPIGQTTTTGAPLPYDNASMMTQVPTVFTPGLSVSDAIAHACGIAPRGQNGVQPSFEYDSANLADADRAILAEIARCLTEGALKGKAVSLVGRTDARGEPEYNMGLGETRATNVNKYLVDLGVGRDRMKSTSRGEIDAMGKDEAGFAKDRRVDIELAM